MTLAVLRQERIYPRVWSMAKLIEARCRCGQVLKVSETAVGKAGKCPDCGRKIRLVAPGYVPGSLRFDHRLTVEEGPAHLGNQYLISGPGPIDVGKLPECHIVLDGQRVSRGHCRLIRDSEGWRLEDQKSTNGTLVNNALVSVAKLQPGDQITVGEYRLSYTTTDPQAVSSPLRPTPVQAAKSPSSENLLDDLYALSEGEAVEVESPPSGVQEGSALFPPQEEGGGPVCPSCQRSLAVNAKICVQCGINVTTGRAILTSHAADVDTVYIRAEGIIRWLSWVIRFGVYPIASEAFGTRKPYVVYSLTAITILTSAWFWAYEWTDSPRMSTAKNYMLWAGKGEPDADVLGYYYYATSYGDAGALEDKMLEIKRKRETEKARAAGRSTPVPSRLDESEEMERLFEGDAREIESVMLEAHKALPPDQRALGQYRGSQLLTNAFLHGGIMHIAGNLLFLLVIGSRVNALLGNVVTALLYPLLAVAASIAHMISVEQEPLHPALGASGAIMGLAGLYLVLMPMYKMHMAAWLRIRLVLSLKLFAIRGFWVVLFYIAFDVVATMLESQDGVAHWAHLGGFIVGAMIGILLLLTRMVNTRGGDILSGLFGRHAWALVGKPGAHQRAPLEYLP